MEIPTFSELLKLFNFDKRLNLRTSLFLNLFSFNKFYKFFRGLKIGRKKADEMHCQNFKLENFYNYIIIFTVATLSNLTHSII